MFSKYFSKTTNRSSTATEATPMLQSRSNNKSNNASTITVEGTTLDAHQVTQAGMAAVQQTVDKIQTLNESAPGSFRVLGLVGGLAVILSNLLFLPGRLLTLHWTNATISFYCILFGTIIVVLELDLELYRQLKEGIRFYAKFLEYTWGRGLLFLFVGTLQAANGNVVDWCVGAFMALVGTVACVAGVKTAHDLRRFRMTMENERDVNSKFRTYDAGNKGYLTLPELRQWIQDAGFDMSPNEVVSAYLALNTNFDDQLSCKEVVHWWARPSRGNLGLEKYSV